MKKQTWTPRILTVRPRIITDLTYAFWAAVALYGAGLLHKFDEGTSDETLIRTIGSKAIQVLSDLDHSGCAKAGFENAGFSVPTNAGACAHPNPTNLHILNLTPMAPDNQYQIGIEDTARMAVTSFSGAKITQLFPNGDAYSGDLATSFNVTCDEADRPSVTKGFLAVGFKTKNVPKSVYRAVLGR